MKESTAKQLMEKVKRDYSDIAEDFDATRRKDWKDFEVFDQYLGGKILDIGCGNGRLKDHIGDRGEYFGCDNNNKFVEIARKRGGDFKVGDFLRLPYPDDYFDLVLSVAAFHHIPPGKFQQKALREVARVMKPGSKGIFMVWNLWQKRYFKVFLKAVLRFALSFGKNSPCAFFVPWGEKVERYYHAFTRRQLKKVFKKAGFKIEKVDFTPSKKNFHIVFKK
ncbi:MAG: methyltransferase type 11 [uncultured bacterium]|nr:MAG: methyltransferase type 11 [uncultured bacterium]